VEIKAHSIATKVPDAIPYFNNSSRCNILLQQQFPMQYPIATTIIDAIQAYSIATKVLDAISYYNNSY